MAKAMYKPRDEKDEPRAPSNAEKAWRQWAAPPPLTPTTGGPGCATAGHGCSENTTAGEGAAGLPSLDSVRCQPGFPCSQDAQLTVPKLRLESLEERLAMAGLENAELKVATWETPPLPSVPHLARCRPSCRRVKPRCS
jgi:hypothetical protein